MTWDDRTNCKTRRHLVYGSAGQDKAFLDPSSPLDQKQPDCSVVLVATLSPLQTPVSDALKAVELSFQWIMFSKVSQPYLVIFPGYLHGLWAGRANVGLVICQWRNQCYGHQQHGSALSSIDPNNLHLSISSATSISMPTPISTSTLQYPRSSSFPLLPSPRCCHIEAFNKYQEVRIFQSITLLLLTVSV